MTGTVKAPFGDSWHDGTGKMSARLTVGNQILFSGAHEQTVIARFRVNKCERVANCYLIKRSYLAHWWFTASSSPDVLNDNPDLPDHKGKAGENHELREVAPRDVVILRPVDGKVLSPGWLLTERTSVWWNRKLISIAVLHDSLVRHRRRTSLPSEDSM
jgi:hypothetical protein